MLQPGQLSLPETTPPHSNTVKLGWSPALTLAGFILHAAKNNLSIIPEVSVSKYAKHAADQGAADKGAILQRRRERLRR